MSPRCWGVGSVPVFSSEQVPCYSDPSQDICMNGSKGIQPTLEEPPFRILDCRWFHIFSFEIGLMVAQAGL